METLSYILDRRSIRRFTDQKIDNDTITKILTAAMYAPSAVNLQPWHYVVIDHWPMMERIMEIHPHARMLQTAAQALGLGSCWVGIHPREERKTAFSRLLSLPSHVLPFALVALGYPEEQKVRPDRFHPEKVKHNGWDTSYFQE